MEQWWHEAVELIASGRREEAIAVTKAAANDGSLAAQVRMAYLGEEAGISRSEADRLISRAEARVVASDATTHWALFGAYEVLLGDLDFEERSRLALFHLEAFAQASGDAQAVFAVGMNYLNGRIGVAPSVELGVDWLHCASALGHDYADHLLREIHGA